MQRLRRFFRAHKTLFLSVGFLVIFSFGVARATPPTSPYNPGATLDPSCVPGGSNCTVTVSPWTITGNDIYYTVGKVGIGTPTPNAPLEVNGNALIDGILNLPGSSSSAAIIVGKDTNTMWGTNGDALASMYNVAGGDPIYNGYVIGACNDINCSGSQAWEERDMNESLSKITDDMFVQDGSSNTMEIYTTISPSDVSWIVGHSPSNDGMFTGIHPTGNGIGNYSTPYFFSTSSVISNSSTILSVRNTNTSEVLNVNGAGDLYVSGNITCGGNCGGGGTQNLIVGSNTTDVLGNLPDTALASARETSLGDSNFNEIWVGTYTDTSGNNNASFDSYGTTSYWDTDQDVRDGAGGGTFITLYNDTADAYFQIGLFGSGQNSTTIRPTAPDGTTPFYLNAYNAHTSGNIFEVDQQGTDLLSVDFSGLLHAGTSTISGTVAQFQNSSGTCSINPTNTALSCSSDMTLKKNITDLADNTPWSFNDNITPANQTILSKVLALNPVNYNWNSEANGADKHTGFIAQEVQQVFPDLVSQDPVTHLFSLNYIGLMPYTIEALKEMNLTITNIDDLTKQNSWRDALVGWFADAGNGIKSLVVHNQICVDDQCLTKDDIRQLLQLEKQSSYTPTSGTSNVSSVLTSSTDDQTQSPEVTNVDVPPPSDDASQTQQVTDPIITSSDPAQDPSSGDTSQVQVQSPQVPDPVVTAPDQAPQDPAVDSSGQQ